MGLFGYSVPEIKTCSVSLKFKNVRTSHPKWNEKIASDYLPDCSVYEVDPSVRDW